VTVNETCLCGCDTETKNNQWSGGIAGHPAIKFSQQKNPPEIFHLEFGDQYVILCIDDIPKGQTLNAEFYVSLLVQFKDILREKNPWEFD
jgi:hypothetical protein